MQDIPTGFAPFVINSNFINFIGPLHCRVVDAVEVFGMRIEKQHCNALDIAHGGLLATFADVVISRSVALARGAGPNVVTISLTTDFIGAVRLGEWIEGRASVGKIGASMGFSSCEVRTGAGIVLRASGVLKLLTLREPSANPAN
jgi:uncharacterized protein (TIGR00369 family)